MRTITHAPMPLKLFGALLALALIAGIAVTVSLTAGQARAQDGGGLRRSGNAL